jgi:Transposase domain (DUF772)/Domain of unknown function (DUF4160)/Transposase DDE domain
MIERECLEDVAYRVIAANLRPDHTTIARFRKRHEDEIAELFAEVLRLCAEAGLASVQVLAVDGTKVHANASHHANRDYQQIAREIVEEAGEIDAHEDELYGDRRGDELPPELSRKEGREAWLREAKQRLEAERAANPKPVPRERPKRLKEAKRRLEQELFTECQANEAYEAFWARGVDRTGRRLGGRPKPYTPPEEPVGKVNVTDLDSKNLKTPRGYMQGYNIQAAVNEAQIIVAAEITTSSPDFGQLAPIVLAARRELAAAGVSETPRVIVADAGYWHHRQIEQIGAQGIPVLVPPDADKTQRHKTGLGRRALRVHAPSTRERARQSALPKTPGARRANVREHEVQPRLHPLRQTRQSRLPRRMAPNRRHPQPSEAPQRPPSGLSTAPSHTPRPAGHNNAPPRPGYQVEVIDSSLDVRQLRLVLAWAELHREELLENWRRARAGETLQEIDLLR